jgi:multidrug efflux pump subunit AcrB
MLLGIVTKNSILLVDYAIIGIREAGLSEYEALLEACRKRARPILMTTVAMIAGMVPLALGIGGSDSSFRRPMAIAVIGGLVTSTALSLLVVPAVYTYVARVERLSRRIFARVVLSPEAALPP